MRNGDLYPSNSLARRRAWLHSRGANRIKSENLSCISILEHEECSLARGIALKSPKLAIDRNRNRVQRKKLLPGKKRRSSILILMAKITELHKNYIVQISKGL